MTRDTVLLTRVSEDNKQIELALRKLSLRLLHRPILTIKPIVLDSHCHDMVENLDLYDHIIFISTNSVIHGLHLLADRWPQWPVKLKWYAVGASTGARLRGAGVNPLVPARFSSEGLLELPELMQIENQRVLIVRGLGGRETLKETLLVRKAKVDYLEVYRRTENEWPTGIVSTLEMEKVLATIVYSADSLATFDQMISQPLRRLPLIVPSERVRDLALSMGYVEVYSTPPSDEAIIQQIMDLNDRSASSHR